MQVAPDHIERESRHYKDDETIGNEPVRDHRDLLEEEDGQINSEVSNQ